MIFIDLETIPHPDAILSPSWQRKVEKDKKQGKEIEDHDAGLHPAFLQIVAIVATVKIGRDWKSFSMVGDDEKDLVSSFEDWRAALPSNNWIFCAHFGKGFDFPALAISYLRHGLALPSCLQFAGKKPWEIPHVDTAEIAKFGGFASMSLDALCYTLGVPTPKDSIDGSQVWQAWKEGRQAEILRYCQKDVSALVQCYHKLEKMGAVK